MKNKKILYDKLNVGCGTDIRQGFVNLDKYKFKGIDVVHDLDKPRLPFKDNSFSYILLSHVLEHVENPVSLMKEVWRISKPEAIVEIGVPYFSGLNAVTDPTHKHFFAAKTFDFFEKGKLGKENYFDSSSSFDFKILKRKIIYSNNFLLKIFNPLINFNQKIYERFFAYIFPAQVLEVLLKTNKKL